jgi:hypothetical protein
MKPRHLTEDNVGDAGLALVEVDYAHAPADANSTDPSILHGTLESHQSPHICFFPEGRDVGVLQQKIVIHLAPRASEVEAFFLKFQRGRAGHRFHGRMMHRFKVAGEALIAESRVDEADEGGWLAGIEFRHAPNPSGGMNDLAKSFHQQAALLLNTHPEPR